MHILIVPSWYSHVRSAGGGSFFRDQALALAAAGHKVGILGQKIWGVRDYRSGPMPVMDDVTVEEDGPLRVYRRHSLHRLPRVPFRDSLAYTKNGLKLFDAYRTAEGPVDIVHAHSALYGGVVAAALKRHTGLPFVITEHSSDFGENKHRWWQKRLITKVFNSAQARIAVSPALATLLITQYPTVADPVEIIPNLLSQMFENPLPDQMTKKSDLEPHQPFVFLCVGRISTEKNQQGLVRAFAEAFPGERNIELHFIGPGDGQPLLNQAQGLGMGERVQVLGVRDPVQVRQRMADASCVVLASFVETFGVVMIEALAMGTPVIGTICGGPEAIITPDNGLLIPPGDDPAMVSALKDMHANHGRYNGENLRRDCLALYGREAVVKSLSAIYDKVLSNKLDIRHDRQPGS